jgi:hypothetical protein
MIVPLAVIAATLVAAVLVPYGYPVKWLTVTMPLEELSPFALIQASAGVVAGALAFTARRDATPGAVPVVFALIGMLASTIMTGIAVKVLADGGLWTHVMVFVAPMAIAPVLAFNALRMRGWDRMLLLIGGFAIAALPYSCPIIPGMFNLFSGGLVYAAAWVTVLVLFVRGMAART